jgi:hypothetical protein
MGLFSRMAGSVGTLFQVGGPGGPGINDNVGSLEATTSVPTVYTDFRALVFEYQQVVPVGTSVTVPSGNTILLAQDWQNNGHVVLQGTSRIVWVF